MTETISSTLTLTLSDFALSVAMSLTIAIFWFGPLFGKKLIVETAHHPEESPEAFIVQTALLTVAGSLIIAGLINPIVHFWQQEAWAPARAISGICAAALTWFFFILPVQLKMFDSTENSYRYLAIKLGYYFAVLQAAGIALSSPW